MSDNFTLKFCTRNIHFLVLIISYEYHAAKTFFEKYLRDLVLEILHFSWYFGRCSWFFGGCSRFSGECSWFSGGVPGFLGGAPGFRWCSGFFGCSGMFRSFGVLVFREVLHASRNKRQTPLDRRNTIWASCKTQWIIQGSDLLPPRSPKPRDTLIVHICTIAS